MVTECYRAGVIVKLPFGAETVAADLRGMRVRPISPSAPPSRGDLGAVVAEAIDQPISGPGLLELAQGRTTATVIVPDATRKIDLPAVLPVILDRLRDAGIEGSAMTILVACGTHPKAEAEEIQALVGPLPEGASLLQHDSRDDSSLIETGELRPGIPIRLHRSAVEADLLLTVGTVRHHYFAGFGGGPKMVFPGIAGHREIQANHARVLSQAADGELSRDPRCEPGLLLENPVAQEIARAADSRPPDMALCLVEGRGGGVAWAAAGPWRPAFEAAVERARRWFETASIAPCDLVVASGGGAPSDSTLIQAHKGLDAACRFLSPGGRLLYVASLDRGPGSEAMLPFLDDPRPQKILSRLAREWVQYGHTTLRVVEKTSRYRVALYSNLEPALARRLGFEPVSSLDEIIDSWRGRQPPVTVGVMSTGTVFNSRFQ
jgi:nickel-dependent lactate racemase